MFFLMKMIKYLILEQSACQGYVFDATHTNAVDYFAANGKVVRKDHPEKFKADWIKEKHGIILIETGIYLLHVEPEIRRKIRKLKIGVFAQTHHQVKTLTQRLLENIS